MSDDMLMCFDSPSSHPPVKTLGLKSPLIPCPTFPFDIDSEYAAVQADPFEKVLRCALRQIPEKTFSLPASPTSKRDTSSEFIYDEPASPENMREVPQDSEIDMSAALNERCLISSTPNPVGLSRGKDASVSPLVDSNPGTPRRKHAARQTRANSQCRLVVDKFMEMPVDNLKAIIQKKMEKLQDFNQNISSARRFSLRRSLSTSDLPMGMRQYPVVIKPFNASRRNVINEASYSSLSNSIINESSPSRGVYANSPIKISTLKKEALKLSSIFQNLTIDTDSESDDTLATPIEEKTKRRFHESFAGKRPEGPDELLDERPPWEWSGSSSEDEDGLPKIRRIRLSVKKESHPSPETASIVTRYKKTRNSLQLGDENESEVQASSQSHPGSQTDSGRNVDETQNITAKASEPVKDTATVPLVIPEPAVKQISLTNLKPKTATTNVVQKGPLKAVLPLPNMMKTKRSSSAHVASAVQSSIQRPRGRDKDLPEHAKRSSAPAQSSSSINQPSPKPKSASNKIPERPSSVPSPGNRVLKPLSSGPVAKGKGSMLKKRTTLAPGKENLNKK